MSIEAKHKFMDRLVILILLPFSHCECIMYESIFFSFEALVRLWWDPLYGLRGGALGLLGLRGQRLRCLRAIQHSVHQG